MNKRIGRVLTTLSLAIIPLVPGLPIGPGLPGIPGTSGISVIPFTGAQPAYAASAEVAQLEDAISIIPTMDENRGGYVSTAFRHWSKGKDTADACTAREEVLIAEAADAPDVSADCKLTGGRWISHYDDQSVTKLASLAVDHVVPLAEAWGSGASEWTPKRREAFANDQDASGTLATVTARSKRERADRDLGGWLPAAPAQQCRYIADWVATKLRWGLTTDKEELEVLKLFADGPCETTVIYYTRVP
ncbi:HNH endonuclease family protein [Streptomyces albipurpureus]|uniref:HNH endonuclease family protein n=1 Tax=Streptomyces albipurpureus TaxID=2897419 RepID=A0ABT0USN5_9ACTN|nr:HNH endonuclease family protein [Streptomyces sp. CWNU-1]MCM2391396.1 HNH endonuclease family protein [Streptomyces sp. CWNU-1]